MGLRTVHHPWKKIVRKINFCNIFFYFYDHHTSDYMHAKFRWNWTIFDFQTVQGTVHLKNIKFSDFNEIWRAYSLKYIDFENLKKFGKNLFFGLFFFMGGALFAAPFWNFKKNLNFQNIYTGIFSTSRFGIVSPTKMLWTNFHIYNKFSVDTGGH